MPTLKSAKPARRHRLALALAAVSIAIGGCATTPRTPFTASEQAAASPAGFDHVRYVQDEPDLADMMEGALKPDGRGEVNALAISGGGANGAYGAGLIYGWTKTGRRPQFQIVTGVSAGALSAPFAFLGPSWDEQLKQTYLGDKIHHLLQGRGLFGVFTSGFFRKSPLEELVRSYVTDDLVRAVAAEHAKGRRLLVATTNLDTEQLIVWDMGAIAARGGPQARDLFAQVLIASASVPGVFPPTMIEVDGAGRRFAEMHVDGQAESPFFAITERLRLMERATDPRLRPHLYVIVNGPRANEFEVTPHATIPILIRTIDAASKASIRSVLADTLDFCRQNGCDLRVADLPPTQKNAALDFSAAHLQSLFAAGEAAIASGQAWEAAAPLPPKLVQAPPGQ
jgi:hypothetical protein